MTGLRFGGGLDSRGSAPSLGSWRLRCNRSLASYLDSLSPGVRTLACMLGGQVVSFSGEVGDLVALQRRLNSMLGPEVVVTEARVAADGFDARFSATGREYRYRIDTGGRRGSVLGSVGVASSRVAVGSSDAGCGGAPARRARFRVVLPATAGRGVDHEAARALDGDPAGDRVEISVRADSFLHQMVRALVGTLVVVGAGRLEPDTVVSILAARDRSRSPQMAPAHGLTLERSSLILYLAIYPCADTTRVISGNESCAWTLNVWLHLPLLPSP